MIPLRSKVLVQGFTLDDNLRQQLDVFFKSLPSRVLLVVNERKYLLSKVYRCLQVTLNATAKVETLEVNQARPGIFTNPECRGFVQADHVVMVLTKNHNLRQTCILRELQLTNTPHTLLMLGCKGRSTLKAANTFQIPNVKALYHLMYNIHNLTQVQSNDSFFKRFAIRE